MLTAKQCVRGKRAPAALVAATTEYCELSWHGLIGAWCEYGARDTLIGSYTHCVGSAKKDRLLGALRDGGSGGRDGLAGS